MRLLIVRKACVWCWKFEPLDTGRTLSLSLSLPLPLSLSLPPSASLRLPPPPSASLPLSLKKRFVVLFFLSIYSLCLGGNALACKMEIWSKNGIAGYWCTESFNLPPATSLFRVFFESGVDPTIPSPTPQKKRGGSRNDRNEDSANPVDRNHMCNLTGFALFSWRCY